MPSTFTHEFDTPAYKGKVSFNTGLFIGGEFVDPIDGGTHEYVIASALALLFPNPPSRIQCREPHDWQADYHHLHGR